MSNSASSVPSERGGPSRLALKGSAKIVCDFFELCVHNVLYQRGLYPADEFRTVRKYGLSMVVSMDPEVTDYLERLMKPLHKWVYNGKITRLVLVIINGEGEIVEKWEFALDVVQGLPEGETPQGSSITAGESSDKEPPLRDTQRTIQNAIRQITASITFLPLLTTPHSFNVLVYANPGCRASSDWDYYPHLDNLVMDTPGVESVAFKEVLAPRHTLGTSVTYKVDDY